MSTILEGVVEFWGKGNPEVKLKSQARQSRQAAAPQAVEASAGAHDGPNAARAKRPGSSRGPGFGSC